MDNPDALIASLAEKYQVNKAKPYFPLNSLRLIYLIFAESVMASPNLIDSRCDDIIALIPKVQSLLDTRTMHRAQESNATVETEWQAVQPDLEEIYRIIDTPHVRRLMEHIFSYIFPLQDSMLISFYSDISQGKKFEVQDIYSIFHVRSMDSIVYSGLVTAILERDVPSENLVPLLQMTINYKLNALYQLNDLVDSIVYAKEDIGSKNFSPFELIRKAVTNVDEAKALIKQIASNFERKIKSFPLGTETEQLITEFTHQLVAVISRSGS